MKKIKLFAFGILLSGFLVGQNPVSINGALSVQGNQIVNKNNTVISFAGPSLFWSNTWWGGEDYYTKDVVSWVKSDWNATIIRAAMGVDESGGYITDTTNKTRVKVVVDEAINQGMYVIIDWHSHHAEDYKSQAIDFFKEMANIYGDYDNVIYEIYNEPLNVSWSSVIKPYAEDVIEAIREIDSDNLIIVGTPNWSQDVDVASNDPITDYDNIAYTLHFYAGTHAENLRDKATIALNNGIALMATEWGTVNANGDGAVDEEETNLWMDFLCENNISHCNWALNDKKEGASALVEGASNSGGWSESDLTTSGKLVKDIVVNWCKELATYEGEIQNNLSGIVAYPNPLQESLTINLNSDDDSETLKITDTSGRIVWKTEKASQSQLQINTSNLNPGIYILEFANRTEINTVRLIKK